MNASGVDEPLFREEEEEEEDNCSQEEDSEDCVDEGEEFFSENEKQVLLSNNKASIAQILLRKSKKCVAKFLKEEYIRHEDTLDEDKPPNLVLTEFLDIILNPSLPFSNSDTIKWLKWLLASGTTPQEFYKQVEQFDNPTTCSLVWTAGFRAYRCRTCSISPCMSLCLECFHAGNHKGHDYNMFKSQAGGACDCGNHAVMAESGFCKRHTSCRLPSIISEPPSDLLTLSKAIMPRLLYRFILHCRDLGDSPMSSIQSGMADVELFIAFLQELCSRGAAMRKVMTEAFCNAQIYKNYTQLRPDCRYYEEIASSTALYAVALESISFGEVPQGYEDILTLNGPLVHKTFLEEIVFWTLKFEFPQKLICLLLNMRPDPTYEDAFARAFVQHYSRISVMLVNSTDTDTLSQRVVHVSVQLFSDHNLAFRMTDSYHLLHVMVLSLKKMLSAVCVPSTLHEGSPNTHNVVNCIHRVMKNHCYWPLVSDLNNILSHKPIAEKFMGDSRLMQEWFSFLSLFQGMNNNVRELNHHVDYEPQSYIAAFSAELEASATPLWAMIPHLKDSSTRQFSIAVMKHCLQELQKWVQEIGFSQPELDHYNEISFHLPLHRNFALVLCQAVKKQGVELADILPPQNFLRTLLVHPLRVQVAYFEILCGHWIRNGSQIEGQAMTYIQCHFCNSMSDPDLFLLQVGAGELPSDQFLLSIFKRFDTLNSLSFSKPSAGRNADSEYQTQILELCLTFLASLTTNRHHIGLSEEEIAQLELMALICMGDKTHSQLMDHIPEKCSGCSPVDFESILNKITKYCQPECKLSGSMKQGTYVPLDHVWEHLFDPIFVILRTWHRKDFQNSLDRFTQFCIDTGRVGKRKARKLWPPYRLPSPVNSSYKDPRRILACRTFHGVLFVLFFKALHELNFRENLLALAVYLLELTIDYEASVKNDEGNVLGAQSLPTNLSRHSGTLGSMPTHHTRHNHQEFLDRSFDMWYSSDDIAINSAVWIDRILLNGSQNMRNTTEDKGPDIEMAEPEGDEPCLCQVELENTATRTPLPYSLALVPHYREEAAPLPLNCSVTGEHLSEGGERTQRNVPQGVPQSRDGNQSSSASTNHPRVRRLSGAPLPDGSVSTTIYSSLSRIPSNVCSEALSAVAESPTTVEEGALPMNHAQYSLRTNEGASEDYVTIQESIISLLLKLHSKLTGRAGSYRAQFDLPAVDSRIGDGPFFIAKALNKLGNLDEAARSCILETQARLFSNIQEEGLTSSSDEESSSKNREDKKRKAKERQKKVMEAFARKQRKFLAKNLTPPNDGDDFMPMAMEEKRRNEKTYDCVICKQSTPSTHDRPVGLVGLLQATSVLAHRTTSPNQFDLPTCDRSSTKLRTQRYSLGHYMKEKSELLSQHFDLDSGLASMNVGWEGGVYVQTCGHHLHLDCHNAYMLSLNFKPRNNAGASEKQEYQCPVCQQWANSVLPISSEIGEFSTARFQHSSFSGDLAVDVGVALKNLVLPVQSPVSVEAASLVIKDIIDTIPVKFRPDAAPNTPLSPNRLMFLSSVFRTNIEIELDLLPMDPRDFEAELDELEGSPFSHRMEPKNVVKRSALMPLLHILAYQAQVVDENGEEEEEDDLNEPEDPTSGGCDWVQRVWASLSQRSCVEVEGLLPLHIREVPMIFRDPITILLHLVILLTPKMDIDVYRCIVTNVYRLVVARAAIGTLRSLSKKQRQQAVTSGPLAPLLAMSYSNLKESPLFCGDELPTSTLNDAGSINQLNCEVQEGCLSFLRIASILKSHLMEEELPDIATPYDECGTLERYLEVWNSCSVVNIAVMSKMCGPHNCPSTNNAVRSELGELSGAMKTWGSELAALFVSERSAPTVSLVSNVRFFPPRLLRLPPTYNEVFQYYHQRRCPQCNGVPKHPGVCLVCGTLLCLRLECCKHLQCCSQNSAYEAVQHSLDCGAGTGIFLAVLQSAVYVVKDFRVRFWGCLHLDSYEEEDKGLKRGKPLFLSEERFSLLEQQWISRSFKHTPHR